MEVLASLQKGPLEAGKSGGEVRFLNEGEAECTSVRGLHNQDKIGAKRFLERVVGSLRRGPVRLASLGSEVRFPNEGEVKSIPV